LSNLIDITKQDVQFTLNGTIITLSYTGEGIEVTNNTSYFKVKPSSSSYWKFNFTKFKFKLDNRERRR
jgi:hypothetical protein